ncbi:hypothetical protein [Bradyrhizobium japonicum]|nr:hypothetical protein [Bradyrhizobium japonicum]MBR0915441.1 hypothetical protein [Bradyrhizobium japonicum]
MSQTGGDAMLEMLQIMTGIGTALIALIIAAMEWRALVGYWRALRIKLRH